MTTLGGRVVDGRRFGTMSDQAGGQERGNSARYDGLAALAIILLTIALIVFVVSSLI